MEEDKVLDKKEDENREHEEDPKEVNAAITEQILDNAQRTQAMHPVQGRDEGGDDDDNETTSINANETLAAPVPKAAKEAAAGPASAGQNNQQNQNGGVEQNGGPREDHQQDSDDNLNVDNNNNARQDQGGNPDNNVQQNQGGNPNNNAQRGQGQPAAGDDVRLDVGLAAAAAQGDQPQQQEGGQEEDANRAFDTLKDLKDLSEEGKTKWDEDTNKPDVNAELKKHRNNLIRARTGNLYKAVIYAKMLEKGERPGTVSKELQTAPDKKPSRFSRFMNSSDFDKLGKIGKITGAVSGLAATADAGYGQSKIKSVVGLVTDFITLVNSVRGIFTKIKNFKKNPTTRKKVFAVIGVITDFLTAISKAASIAKTIMTWTGNKNSVVAGDVSTFVGLGGQVTGMTGIINTLQELDSGIKVLKEDQAAEKERVLNILHGPKPNAAAGGNGNAAAGGQASARRKPKKLAERRRLNKEKKQEEKERPLSEELITDAFNDNTKNLSEEDKAVLASYLGRERVIAKRKLALSNTAIGLITSAFGIGASISGGVASIRGQKKAKAYQAAVEEAESKGEEAPEKDKSVDPAATSATALGGMASATTLLSTAGTHYARKGMGHKSEGVAGTIREGLWGALHNLGSDDENGLRRIAGTLKPGEATGEDLQKADSVVKKYDTASKQFAGSGVMYAKLFEANDIDIFKDALVAGI